MQSSAAMSLLLPLLILAGIPLVAGGRGLRRAAGSEELTGGAAGTITKVVKLLQQMLDDSKKEEDKERDLYAKFKCYCDDNTDEKTTSIDSTTKQIGQLGNDIEELQGSNGELSLQCAQLKADMDDNEKTVKEAKAIRDKANKAFLAEEADLTAAIGQMKQAIKVLADIGADQAQQAGYEHAQFMAGYKGSLLNLQSTVKQALVAADSLLAPEQRRRAAQLLQAPFTGTYSSQSGEVVGILKQMRDTFEANLENAKNAEKTAAEAHKKFIETKKKEFETMKGSFDTKQASMGTNDGDLTTKTTELSSSKQQLSDDQDFLAKLTPMCEDKAKEYEKRKEFRVNEQAAVSEAIALLDNEVASKTFGSVKATSTGATGFIQPEFMQLSSRHRLVRAHAMVQKPLAVQAQELLQRASAAGHSRRLARVAGLLAAGNPFEKVLLAIQDMMDLIDDEAKTDKEQNDWCKTETTANKKNLGDKTKQEGELNTAITTLETSIDSPGTGLKALIQSTEDSLAANSKSQADETKARREENVVYQRSVGNSEEAKAILKKALDILAKYYADLEKQEEDELNSFLQADPAPPSTWTGKYEGQKTSGNKVIDMLKFVLKETEKEAMSAHEAEHKAQMDYEDSMAELVKSEDDLGQALLKHQKGLADAEEDLVNKRADLEKTEREKIAIERYIESIKPGCDFILKNYADRETNRGKEQAALKNAVKLLKGSPAFAAAELAAKHEAQGQCKDKCAADESHVDCKACMAGVSVPGYCAGHPGATGC